MEGQVAAMTEKSGSRGPDTGPHEIPSIEVGDLLQRADAGEDLVLLDVRNDEEFRGWRLEARRPIATVHVPYFDFIEDAERALARVPRGRKLVVVCAQGGSSEMVVDLLGEAGVRARNLKGGMAAYGDYLDPVRVPLRPHEERSFELWQVNRRGKGCLSYVVLANGEAVVIDPARDVAWYEGFVSRRGGRIVRVLDTHVHADHVSGGPALARQQGVPYFVNAGRRVAHAVEPLADGAQLPLGGRGGMGLRLLAVSTPGHTPGSTSFLVNWRYLLTGDTLFVSSVGRPDLGGHLLEWGRDLFRTLQARIAPLPDDVLVLPAHHGGMGEMGPDGVVAARLGDLRLRVPEMRLRTAEELVDAVRAAVKEPPAAYGEIIRVNLGLASADPDKIAEWELGPNQCAVAAGKAPTQPPAGLVAR